MSSKAMETFNGQDFARRLQKDKLLGQAGWILCLPSCPFALRYR
jgi:hypothetical protein